MLNHNIGQGRGGDILETEFYAYLFPRLYLLGVVFGTQLSVYLLCGWKARLKMNFYEYYSTTRQVYGFLKRYDIPTEPLVSPLSVVVSFAVSR